MTEHLPIVSSSHLMSEKSMTLGEFEYALTMVNNAFQRWMQSCCMAVELQDLSPLDILALHNLHHRDRPKRITDVAFTLNIEDIHNVSYSVRKLVKKGLVIGERQGKDTYYQLNDAGKHFCLQYKEVREQCLVEVVSKLNVDNELGDVAATMRTLSGIYDQASRAVRSL
ncbi:MAG: winged helix DNA-binding protein [Aliivibrio sp.]|uniref:winged helix DNA-binding protein n=1 Tax=Aliivibrio sp. TaxID=1872443 RepID=UPI001A3D8118|nr:winged helix DNA-binding protein [Aliivibrio sp.]